MKKHIFRVWDNDHNKYFEPTYEAWKGKLEDLHIGLLGSLLMRTMDGTVYCDDIYPGRFEIEMASNIIDMNGNVMHEGDIVKSNTYNIEAEMVTWEAEMWEPIQYYMSGPDFEIIGNIHQNPELIK